jgi:hexosaminidase
MTKKRVWALLSAGMAIGGLAVSAFPEAASQPSLASLPVVPKPVSMQSTEGKAFHLDSDVSVRTTGAVSPDCVASLTRAIKDATEIEPTGTAANAQAKAIVLRLDPSVGKGRPEWQAKEAYHLEVARNGSAIEIAASDEHGLFNGIQTLAQLAAKSDDGTWRVPSVKIEDYPRFQWRGYLLDTARHFRPKAEVLRYVDLLALHKLNLFHLHLTDDQGWRIEIKRYPKLTEVGAAVPDYTGGVGPGRFYTQDDIKEIVAYAAERHITVVPEIEMPGHSTAATTSYPELSCQGKPTCELCVSKESTFEFMTNVLDEVMPLFPSPFIHIGADEVRPEPWRACPSCKKRMDELATAKLPDGVKPFRIPVTTGAGRPFNEDIGRLQGEFIRRIDQHIAKKGKRMVGWDEILEGGLAKDSPSVAMVWRSAAAISAALEQGRDVVVCIHPPYYLDNGTSLQVTYLLEPTEGLAPALLQKAGKPGTGRVLGLQGNMWGEGTPTQQRVDQMTFPRLCALAEVGWSPVEARDFKDFITRMGVHVNRLAPYGIKFDLPKP